MNRDQSGSSLVSIRVDLTGSRLGRGVFSVRLLMDASKLTFDELRRLCAEFYDVPIRQVSEPWFTTRETFDLLDES